MLNVYALLMRDVLASRAYNSVNDQDSIQEFLKWSEQILQSNSLQKKPPFRCWRLIRSHHRFFRDVALRNWKK